MSTEVLEGALPASAELDSPKARQILAGARSVFNERGYEGASMNEIAARAGVSKGTLYNYFPDKQALFAAHVQAMCEKEAAITFSLDPDTPDLRRALLELGRRYLHLTTRPDATATYRIVVAEAPRFPELGRIFLDFAPRRGMRRVAAWLKELDRRGRLRVPEPERAAWQLMMLIRGLPAYEHQLAQTAGIPEAEIEAMVASAADVFLRAYSPCSSTPSPT